LNSGFVVQTIQFPDVFAAIWTVNIESVTGHLSPPMQAGVLECPLDAQPPHGTMSVAKPWPRPRNPGLSTGHIKQSPDKEALQTATKPTADGFRRAREADEPRRLALGVHRRET
jgi:hypothetical protein